MRVDRLTREANTLIKEKELMVLQDLDGNFYQHSEVLGTDGVFYADAGFYKHAIGGGGP